MAYYFGFKPSKKLSEMIDHIDNISFEDSDKPLYPLRDKITHQINHELVENLLAELVEITPHEGRRASLTKIIHTIESSSDTMLNILLSKDTNAEVIPNVRYLEDETVFEDKEGNRRIGFELKPEIAEQIIAAFDATTPNCADDKALRKALMLMSHAVLDHFITRFSETLPLGMIKRKSIPVAKSGISRGLDMALAKLLPQLDDAGLNRVVNFYSQFIFEKN